MLLSFLSVGILFGIFGIYIGSAFSFFRDNKLETKLLEADELNEKLINCLLDCQKENLLPENCQSLIKEEKIGRKKINDMDELIEEIKKLKPFKTVRKDDNKSCELFFINSDISMQYDYNGGYTWILKKDMVMPFIVVKNKQKELYKIFNNKIIELLGEGL